MTEETSAEALKREAADLRWQGRMKALEADIADELARAYEMLGEIDAELTAKGL